MKLSSLGFRLFLLSLLSILLALIATTVVLSERFHAYFEGRVFDELHQHLEQLTTNLSLDKNGVISVARLLDRRFEQPFGGLYWQILEAGEPVAVSRSLWGGAFDIPETNTPGQQFKTSSVSPIGTDLLVLGWPVLLGEDTDRRTLVLAVASDASQVTAAATGFRNFLVGWLAIMFAGLLLAAWAQVQIGLAPIKNLRNRIENIRDGTSSRMSGNYPSEVKPLVDEVNSLLDLHDSTLAAARSRSSDLAHGLKTPLTVMRALAQDISAAGQPDLAQQAEDQISSMHLFIERELARANIDQSTPAAIPAAATIRRMAGGIRKLPGAEKLNWTLNIPDDLVTPFDEHELSELVGNLLDNARKWAKSCIIISASNNGPHSGRIDISDDGPGISKDQRAAVLKRGEYLSETLTGGGLGLTIAKDLVDEKSCDFELGDAKLGGLKASMIWQ